MTWVWKVPSPLPSRTDTSFAVVVGDGEVGAAVAVEVARHDRDGIGPHRVGDLGLEGAVAVAQQHRHVVRAVVGDGEVGAAVAGEVARHDRDGTGPHRVGDLGLEGAVAVAQQDRHVVAVVVGDGEVGAAVAVEVARHDRVWVVSQPRSVTWGWNVPSPLPSSTDTVSSPPCWRRPGRCGRRR